MLYVQNHKPGQKHHEYKHWNAPPDKNILRQELHKRLSNAAPCVYVDIYRIFHQSDWWAKEI